MLTAPFWGFFQSPDLRKVDADLTQIIFLQYYQHCTAAALRRSLAPKAALSLSLSPFRLGLPAPERRSNPRSRAGPVRISRAGSASRRSRQRRAPWPRWRRRSRPPTAPWTASSWAAAPGPSCTPWRPTTPSGPRAPSSRRWGTSSISSLSSTRVSTALRIWGKDCEQISLILATEITSPSGYVFFTMKWTGNWANLNLTALVWMSAGEMVGKMVVVIKP